MQTMKASAKAQPNIALVKYWGKRDRQRNLPAVSSLSITLDSLWTTMSVSFDGVQSDSLEVNGVPAPALLARISDCLDRLVGSDRPRAAVVSENNFPVGAGLASSASAFAALVVAANEAASIGLDRHAMAQQAGAASGSAARSLFGGFVELTAGDESVEVTEITGPEEWPLSVVVAVTDEGQKPVSSGDAMIRSAETSPFYRAWVDRQQDDLAVAHRAVIDRDFALLGSVAEHNCLKMHSVMWSSRPPIVYWNRATIACMETVRELQARGEPVFFTIDAGPQVKAVCLPESADTIREALDKTTGVSRTMITGLGAGARLIDR